MYWLIWDFIFKKNNEILISSSWQFYLFFFFTTYKNVCVYYNFHSTFYILFCSKHLSTHFSDWPKSHLILSQLPKNNNNSNVNNNKIPKKHTPDCLLVGAQKRSSNNIFTAWFQLPNIKRVWVSSSVNLFQGYNVGIPARIRTLDLMTMSTTS